MKLWCKSGRLIVILGLFAVGCFAGHAEDKAPVRPNMIVLMADDLGYGDLGCTGSTQIPTPHIDSLAKQGVFCSRGYVSAPMCAPSRMAMLTGKFPKRFGITTNPNVKVDYLPESHYGLPKTEKCLPEYLKEFGYESAIIGKWHLGHTPGFEPTARGFDCWWGFLGGSRSYFPGRKEQEGLNPSQIVSNYTKVSPVSYLTDDIARESIRFIDQQKNRDQPFFLFVSFNAPHSPYQAKSEDKVLFQNVKPAQRSTYCAMVYALDKAVGRILESLNKSGKERDTIVVFLSDNGGAPYGPACNAPLKGEKRLHYEGGVRVPMIVRYPANTRMTPGSTSGQVVSAVDFLPTLLVANGAAIPDNLDGKDILPLLSEGASAVSRTLYWCTDYTSAILDGNLKYVLVPDRAPQLYDMESDMAECHDLYPTQMQKASHLARKLGKYLTSTPACRFPDAVSWSSGLLKQYNEAKPAVQPGKADSAGNGDGDSSKE